MCFVVLSTFTDVGLYSLSIFPDVNFLVLDGSQSGNPKHLCSVVMAPSGHTAGESVHQSQHHRDVV